MKLETILSQGLFNTQPPTGESVFAMMLTWRGDAGYHAAYGMNGAGATEEDTIRKRTGIRQGEVGYLLSQGGTHKNIKIIIMINDYWLT